MVFIKNKEDFTCAHCGYKVVGNGYTNHCPQCLWSQHVDNDPGDRNALCGGLMSPQAIEKSGSVYNVIHVCQKCSMRRKNKIVPADNMETVVAVSKKVAESGIHLL
jgi:DNA-directed RNA polymerase subunit RPC12/RpoP